MTFTPLAHVPHRVVILVWLACPNLLVRTSGKLLRQQSHVTALNSTARTGIAMPGIIYGTAWKEERTTQLVLTALQAGFTGIDTANQPLHYREDLVGVALEQFLGQGSRSRGEIFLQTKYSPYQDMSKYPAELLPYNGAASLKEQVKQSVAKSLRNLRTSYIDSLVLHSPMDTIQETMEVWAALEEFVDAGVIKQLGISNIYSLQELIDLHTSARVKPSVVQNRFYAATCFDFALRKWCSANSVKYQSFWTLTANGHFLYSTRVTQLAQARSLTKEQLWFLFTMSQGIVPLTGTTSQLHMKQDLALLQEKTLSAAEVESLHQLIREKTFCTM